MTVTTLAYTGAVQDYVVPAGISRVKIECYGAGTNSFTGKGGYATGEINVTPGETLKVYVGGQGGAGGGWNGGGAGGGTTQSRGGGGASDVRRGGTALANRVLVAGGGGARFVGTPTDAGYGGGLVGNNGTGAASGGTQSAGGAGYGGASSGALGVAGVGGGTYGAGGGGGYYGGGGARGTTSNINAGGGSSYVGTAFNASTIVGGGNSGDGSVVITTIANVAPNAPTLSSMASGEVIDRAAANRASHVFSDSDAGDSQSAFDHRYRLVGAATWTTAYVSSPNQYVDYPAGTFAAGDYERQVRTYDAQGVVGPWSGSGFFTAAAAPATPTITSPINGGTVATGSASVTWSAPNQDAYQVQVMDGGVVEYDSGTVVSPLRSATVPFATNMVTRTVRVRVRSTGLWSAWYSISVNVSYTPPLVPTYVLTAAGTTIAVQVANPAGGTTVVENLVYVDDGLADGETLRAHVPPNGSWTYWTPRSGLDYAGRVRVEAVGNNGTRTTSA